VTSTSHTANLGGLAGADQICNARAAAESLPGTYIALLSVNAQSARDRLVASGARGWQRVDGKPVADEAAELFDGQLFYPLNIDETGAAITTESVHAWTGATADGSITSFTTCGDWASNTAQTGAWGQPFAGGGSWLIGSKPNCGSDTARLYCFGVDHSTPVAPAAPPAGSKIAFLSDFIGNAPSGGLSSLDAVCQNEANANGFGTSAGNTFLAFAATQTASADSRFNSATGQYVRLDGVVLGSSAEVLSADWAAALNQTSTGGYHLSTQAWFGSTSTDMPGPANDDNCMNWSGGTHGHVIQVMRLEDPWATAVTGCNTITDAIICLEQ